MNTKLRIIVGPTAMYVERAGIKSEEQELTNAHTPADVRAAGQELWETIRPFVSWKVWIRHRVRMARQRRLTSLIQGLYQSSFYPGPRPDLIATVPWKHAKLGEWFSVPHGVAARLQRTG